MRIPLPQLNLGATFSPAVVLSQGPNENTEKKETLERLITAVSLAEAKSIFRDKIHRVRNSSSQVSRIFVDYLPTVVSAHLPGCQNPRGFIYSTLTMVIRSLNEDKKFFDTFDPLGMHENGGTAIFRNIPDRVLLDLMNNVVQNAGLAENYFADLSSVKSYIDEFKSFFEGMKVNPNPTDALYEYGEFFQEKGFYNKFLEIDKKSKSKFARLDLNQKCEKYFEFLKKYSSVLNSQSTSLTVQKHTRGFVYRILIFAIVERNRTSSLTAERCSDFLIRCFPQNNNGSPQDILNLMNNVTERIGLGSNYFKNFDGVKKYIEELIQFLACDGKKLSGRYANRSTFVRNFLAETEVHEAQSPDEVLPLSANSSSSVSTALLVLGRQRVVGAVQSVREIMPSPESVIDNPVAWRGRRAAISTIDTISHPKRVVWQMKKTAWKARQTILFLISFFLQNIVGSLLWSITAFCLAWFIERERTKQ